MATPSPRRAADRSSGTGQLASGNWRTPAVDALCDAIVAMKTRDEAAAFLRDVATLSEIEALSHRLHAARLLDRGTAYAAVADHVGASTTTVTRVALWLRRGEGGYRLAIDRLGPLAEDPVPA
jgi:TrpR-related protein YerC/YecD